MDDEDKVKRERELADRRALKEHQAMLRWMLSQKPARRFLAWLLFDPLTANLQGTVFDRDPLAMATKVGIQNVGLEVQRQLQDADFDQFLALLAEWRKLAENIPNEEIA